MSISSFLVLLEESQQRMKDGWSAELDHRCIHLRRKDSEMIFSPMTAVYWYLTKKEIHRGSFWCEEMESQFGLPWWDINTIVYAQMALGLTYNKKLRNRLLIACNLPADRF